MMTKLKNDLESVLHRATSSPPHVSFSTLEACDSDSHEESLSCEKTRTHSELPDIVTPEQPFTYRIGPSTSTIESVKPTTIPISTSWAVPPVPSTFVDVQLLHTSLPQVFKPPQWSPLEYSMTFGYAMMRVVGSRRQILPSSFPLTLGGQWCFFFATYVCTHFQLVIETLRCGQMEGVDGIGCIIAYE